MNRLARVLLLAGGFVLALLIGVLIGRGQSARTPPQGNTEAVQIDTAPPPMAAPPPLPAPVEAAAPKPPPPKAAPIVQAAPDVQVQEDAAAVGMTTRAEGASQGGPNAEPPPHAASEPAGNSLPPG
jgi:hypothetical protein